MLRMVLAAVVTLSFALPCAALAAAAAAAPTAERTLAVTIYNDDLALVRDQRTLDISAGRQRVEFQNVSAEIKPETVSLAGSGLAIIEQNFDYDLLTPATLMEKAVGGQVTIVRINPATGAETREAAQVLATNGGVTFTRGDESFGY